MPKVEPLNRDQICTLRYRYLLPAGAGHMLRLCLSCALIAVVTESQTNHVKQWQSSAASWQVAASRICFDSCTATISVRFQLSRGETRRWTWTWTRIRTLDSGCTSSTRFAVLSTSVPRNRTVCKYVYIDRVPGSAAWPG